MKTKEEECIESILNVTLDITRTDSEMRVALHYILSDYVSSFAKLHHNIRNTSLNYELKSRMEVLYKNFGLHSDIKMPID